ncbi:hypothetical protein D3C79_865240 [compost metagenome]
MLVLIGWQQADLVAGPTKLERAGVLQVFAFEQHVAATRCRQPGAIGQRGDADCRAQCHMGILDRFVQRIEVMGIDNGGRTWGG